MSKQSRKGPRVGGESGSQIVEAMMASPLIREAWAAALEAGAEVLRKGRSGEPAPESASESAPPEKKSKKKRKNAGDEAQAVGDAG